MKKLLISLMSIFTFAAMVGCANTAHALRTALPEPAVKTVGAAPAPSSGAKQTATEIGEEAAKKIALEHAGVAESDVVLIKSDLDYDDGHKVYDLAFYAGGKAYDYELDAYTGAIRSYDYDIDANSASSQKSDSSIGLDQAKAIALDRAGLSGRQVTYTKTAFAYDNGVTVYHIELTAGSMEYELDINAATGAVLEYDVDSIYD